MNDTIYLNEQSKEQYTENGSKINALDTLFDRTRSYRKSEAFRNLLDFCGRFKPLAPYNAMLVRAQMPAARFVATERQWNRDYNRKVKPDVNPLIILRQFGPVEFVFEVCETEYPFNPECHRGDTIQEYLEELAQPYKATSQIDRQLLERIVSNLQYHAISLDMDMRAGANYGGHITASQDYLQNLMICVDKRKCRNIEYQALFRISVNKNMDDSARFSTICHELGHLFCHHLPLRIDKKDWEHRTLTHTEKEFEAESVSWLVCQRLGIDNQAEKYLATYMDENEEIPAGVSMKYIFDAFDEIWRMTQKSLSYKDGIPYKHDKHFKDFTQRYLAGKVTETHRQGDLFV